MTFMERVSSASKWECGEPDRNAECPHLRMNEGKTNQAPRKGCLSVRKPTTDATDKIGYHGWEKTLAIPLPYPCYPIPSVLSVVLCPWLRVGPKIAIRARGPICDIAGPRSRSGDPRVAHRTLSPQIHWLRQTLLNRGYRTAFIVCWLLLLAVRDRVQGQEGVASWSAPPNDSWVLPEPAIEPLPENAGPPSVYPLPQPPEVWTPQEPPVPGTDDSELPSAEEMLRKSVPLGGHPNSAPPVGASTEYFYQGLGWQESSDWLMGSGNRFGMFTLSDTTTRVRTVPDDYLSFHWAIHWLNGPTTTDMPPRLYDLALSWNEHQVISPTLRYDLSVSLGFYSDFEASARQGVRFPSWFVFHYEPNERRRWLLGIDVLDRQDLFCLPVVGAILTPNENLRLELIFPRPRVMWRPFAERWLYARGEMGGGTWAIDRVWGESDVVNYRDFRALVGITGKPADTRLGALEVGYVFDRQLDYRSGGGDFRPKPVWVIQSVYAF